jgi:hypothetical protein
VSVAKAVGEFNQPGLKSYNQQTCKQGADRTEVIEAVNMSAWCMWPAVVAAIPNPTHPGRRVEHENCKATCQAGYLVCVPGPRWSPVQGGTQR